MNLLLIVLLLTSSTHSQLQQFNNNKATNQSQYDQIKQQQIDQLLTKCSQLDTDQCDVCSLCENESFCRKFKNKKLKSTFNTDSLTQLKEIIDFNCYCVPGYTGTYCQIDINECLTQPCSNNSTCIDKINSFECECECSLGFTGQFCEHNINECESSPCLYGSKCFDLINDYKCNCLPGYTGTQCSIDINECAVLPCQNNATCLNLINKFECNCSHTGFQGLYCEQNINDCLNTIQLVSI